MQDWVKNKEKPKFRAGQIFDWLYKNTCKKIMRLCQTFLKDLRDKLSNSFDIHFKQR